MVWNFISILKNNYSDSYREGILLFSEMGVIPNNDDLRITEQKQGGRVVHIFSLVAVTPMLYKLCQEEKYIKIRLRYGIKQVNQTFMPQRYITSDVNLLELGYQLLQLYQAQPCSLNPAAQIDPDCYRYNSTQKFAKHFFVIQQSL